ncbi:MAG: cupin domain-containing protein [Saprospiraceae bacterium]|nr:cupin domain-containing protein [Lewinella sp.]
MKNALFFLFLCCLAINALAQENNIPSDNYRWKDLKVVKQDTRKTRQILDGPTVFMDRFEIHATTLKPGMAPHGAHKHDTEEELIIVKEGRVKVTIEDETQILGPGSIAFAEIGDMHGFSNAGDTEATYYVIKMKGRGKIDRERGAEAGGSFMIDFDELEFKPHDKGGLRNYFRRSTAIFDYFEMHMTTLNPGIQSHPPHTHRAAEIILVMDGKVVESIDGQDYKGQKGDLIFLASEIPHGITNRSKQKTCRYFAFQWSE